MGTAGTLLWRDPRGVPITALIGTLGAARRPPGHTRQDPIEANDASFQLVPPAWQQGRKELSIDSVGSSSV